jgi:hypothetical protein
VASDFVNADFKKIRKSSRRRGRLRTRQTGLLEKRESHARAAPPPRYPFFVPPPGLPYTPPRSPLCSRRLAARIRPSSQCDCPHSGVPGQWLVCWETHSSVSYRLLYG